MNVQKINPNTKNSAKRIAGYGACGVGLAAINALGSGIKPKDIFQYKDLSKAQKNIIKTSALGGVIVAALLAIQGKMAANKTAQKEEK